MPDLGKRWRLSDTVVRFLNFVNPTTLEPGTGYQHWCTSITNFSTTILRAACFFLPACRRLLFPLLHAETKEIGDVCTQASFFQHGHNSDIISFKQNIQSDELL